MLIGFLVLFAVVWCIGYSIRCVGHIANSAGMIIDDVSDFARSRKMNSMINIVCPHCAKMTTMIYSEALRIHQSGLGFLCPYCDTRVLITSGFDTMQCGQQMAKTEGAPSKRIRLVSSKRPRKPAAESRATAEPEDVVACPLCNNLIMLSTIKAGLNECPSCHGVFKAKE